MLTKFLADLRLFRFLKPYRGQILALTFLIFLQVFADLQLPSFMAKIVDEGVVGGDMKVIYLYSSVMLVVSLLGGVAAVAVGFLSARVASGFARDVRQQIFTKVEGLSVQDFSRFSTASLITRSTNDVQQTQMIMVFALRMLLMAPFMGIGALYFAIKSAPDLSWIIGLAIAVLLAMVVFLLTITLPKFTILQKLIDRLNLVTRESLTGLRVVRAFRKEKSEEKKFDVANADLMQVNLFVNRVLIIVQPFMMLLMNLAAVAAVWFGGHLISQNGILLGDMLAFIQYASFVITSSLMMSMTLVMVPRVLVSAKRINEVIEMKPTNNNGDLAKDARAAKQNNEGVENLEKARESLGNNLENITGQVEFKNVYFHYSQAGRPVLADLNFVAEAGQTTAIIGSTGSGKSTLVGLIPRLYEVSTGQVLLDGVDVRTIDKEALRQQIGFVPQKATLFSGSIRSNVGYGKKTATVPEINQALAIAQASDFVGKLEKGLDNEIAQGGSNVSGGQKQRLAIARALAIDPKIYIFDDSFSALDFKTDAKLRQALKAETKDKTVIIVGQRIGTIMDADKIIVLDEGRIVGQGTHKELLANNQVYQEIALSQLSDRELTKSHLKA